MTRAAPLASGRPAEAPDPCAVAASRGEPPPQGRARVAPAEAVERCRQRVGVRMAGRADRIRRGRAERSPPSGRGQMKAGERPFYYKKYFHLQPDDFCSHVERAVGSVAPLRPIACLRGCNSGVREMDSGAPGCVQRRGADSPRPASRRGGCARIEDSSEGAAGSRGSNHRADRFRQPRSSRTHHSASAAPPSRVESLRRTASTPTITDVLKRVSPQDIYSLSFVSCGTALDFALARLVAPATHRRHAVVAPFAAS